MLALFHTNWPWMGLGMAIVLVILLFFTNLLRSDTSVSRWRDPKWCAWFGTCAYMLHNFEEYGIDLFGNTYEFPNLMDRMMGIQPPAAFYTAVNVGAVWFASTFLAKNAGKNHPVISMSMMGLLLTNALSHLIPLFTGTYTAGVFIGIVVFIPASIWFYYVLVIKGEFSGYTLAASLIVPFIIQSVLMMSILLYRSSVLGDVGMVIIQIINAALFVALAYGAEKILKDKMYKKAK
ncbi:MAG: HXXEE domain-containing protein [Eubacterium sp.]|nr:HXXEE domain-containing protein [Eubacterium sp.]